jgi:hypothetical protein
LRRNQKPVLDGGLPRVSAQRGRIGVLAKEMADGQQTGWVSPATKSGPVLRCRSHR